MLHTLICCDLWLKCSAFISYSPHSTTLPWGTSSTRCIFLSLWLLLWFWFPRFGLTWLTENTPQKGNHQCGYTLLRVLLGKAIQHVFDWTGVENKNNWVEEKRTNKCQILIVKFHCIVDIFSVINSILPSGTAGSRSRWVAITGADCSHSRQCLWINYIHSSAFQKRTRSVSLFCPTQNIHLVYFLAGSQDTGKTWSIGSVFKI